MDAAVLDVFPAQRFIRVRPVAAPRAYHEAALGQIRRKDDLAFWVSLNRDFGVPWGPWGFNSGCGVEDVDRDEAIAAGVMQADDVVAPLAKGFNDGLSASVRDISAALLAELTRSTGGKLAGGRLKAVSKDRKSKVTSTPKAPVWPAKFASVKEAADQWNTDFGIASVQTQGKLWGAKFSNEKQVAAHLQHVGEEFTRMVSIWPALKGKLHGFYAVRNKRGLAHMDGSAPWMSTKATEWEENVWNKISNWEAQNGRSFGTERKGKQVWDNFRHELGHTLSTPEVMANFKKMMKNNGLSLLWFRQNVSDYGGTKPEEALAESFGIFTREDYQPATLPKPLEDFFTKLLK